MSPSPRQVGHRCSFGVVEEVEQSGCHGAGAARRAAGARHPTISRRGRPRLRSAISSGLRLGSDRIVLAPQREHRHADLAEPSRARRMPRALRSTGRSSRRRRRCSACSRRPDRSGSRAIDSGREPALRRADDQRSRWTARARAPRARATPRARRAARPTRRSPARRRARDAAAPSSARSHRRARLRRRGPIGAERADRVGDGVGEVGDGERLRSRRATRRAPAGPTRPRGSARRAPGWRPPTGSSRCRATGRARAAAHRPGPTGAVSAIAGTLMTCSSSETRAPIACGQHVGQPGVARPGPSRASMSSIRQPGLGGAAARRGRRRGRRPTTICDDALRADHRRRARSTAARRR